VFEVKVYDIDMGSSNDLIGQAAVPLLCMPLDGSAYCVTLPLHDKVQRVTRTRTSSYRDDHAHTALTLHAHCTHTALTLHSHCTHTALTLYSHCTHSAHTTLNSSLLITHCTHALHPIHHTHRTPIHHPHHTHFSTTMWIALLGRWSSRRDGSGITTTACPPPNQCPRFTASTRSTLSLSLCSTFLAPPAPPPLTLRALLHRPGLLSG
jgi:hypothetical protein